MMKLYRKIYRLMPTTAEALLALPNGLGGLGCFLLKDKTFQGKWAVLMRNYLNNVHQKAAVVDVIQRANRKNGVHLLPGQGGITHVAKGLYVTGMLEAGKEVGMHLHTGGDKFVGTNYEQIRGRSGIFSMKEEQLLENEGIITVGDLTMQLDDERVFVPEINT